MRNLILTLVLCASFGVGGAFAASNPPSPTNSVKAAKLLLGEEAAAKVEAQNYAKDKFGVDKSAAVTGVYDDSAAKIAANKARRDAKLKVARAELAVARLEASEFDQNGGQIGAEAG
jgi:hypothetical protein